MIVGFAPDHPSWEVLRAEMEARISASLEALSSPALDYPTTQFERGQVAALRRMIGDIQEVPVEPIITPGYG